MKQVSARGTLDEFTALYPPSNPIITAHNAGQINAPCDSAGPWTNPCKAIGPNNYSADNWVNCNWGTWNAPACDAAAAGQGYASVTNSNDWLILPVDMNAESWGPPGYGTTYDYALTIDQVLVGLWGYTTSPNNQLDVALSFNGGASPATVIRQVTLPASNGPVSVGKLDFTAWGIDSWVLDTIPRFNRQEWNRHSGTAQVSGSTVSWLTGNANPDGAQDPFSTYWFEGGNGTIWLAASGDACAFDNTYDGSNWPNFLPTNSSAHEYALTGMLDGANLTIADPPPEGIYNWCSHNTVVMIRRHGTADSTPVYIQSVNLQTVDHQLLDVVNDSSSSMFFDTPVNSGYFGFNGGLFWINTSTGETSWFGLPQLPASTLVSGDGWGGNPGLCPVAGTSFGVDQTKSRLTWYCGLMDSAGKFIIVQGQYKGPTSAPPYAATYNGGNSANTQINQYTQDATCQGAYPNYCISFGSGALVFTDLTPSSAGQSVTDMLVNTGLGLQPAFNASIFGSCAGAVGQAVQQGIIFTDCLPGTPTSPGSQDSYAWVLAVAPGDGNPAHAGTSAGPHLLGTVNTFDGLMLRWRGLHYILDQGAQAWGSYGANPDAPRPVTMTNTTLTPTGSSLDPSGTAQDCSTYGGTTGQKCSIIQIVPPMGSRSSEPYFASAFQTVPANTPGVLGKSQPQAPAPCTLTPDQTAAGDTTCYAADVASFGVDCNNSGAGSCSGGEEMTLVAKDYHGVLGLQIWQRGAGPLSYSGATTMYFQASNVSSVNWNPSVDPTGWDQFVDYDSVTSSAGHGFTQPSLVGQVSNSGSMVCTNPLFTQYQSRTGSYPSLSVAPLFYASAVAPFANACLVGAFSNDVQSHPNGPGDLATAEESMQGFDVRPMLANNAISQSGVPNFNRVTGQLYQQVWPAYQDPDTLCSVSGCSTTQPYSAQLNRKLVPTAMSCGSHPLLDISGPGSVIDGTMANSYKACIPRANGECYAGSQVGEIYVNCPDVLSTDGSAGCTGNGLSGGTILGMGNDICVWNNYSGVQMIHEFTMEVSDASAAQERDLSTSIGRVRMSGGMGNARVTPDNTWIVFPASYLNFNGQDIWMAKLPPRAPQDYDRSQFIPGAVTVTPPSIPSTISNAVIEFGYYDDSYNVPHHKACKGGGECSNTSTLSESMSGLFCTTRSEACITNAMSGTPFPDPPFTYLSEAASGVACAYPGSCTIYIPEISQRILYYRVLFRDNSNKVVARTNVSAVATP